MPQVCIVAVGGFVLSNGGADEIIALDCPSESEVESVLEFLRKSQMVDKVKLIENSVHHVFIHLISRKQEKMNFAGI